MKRKTKIICTLGPATDDPSVLRELMLSGMNTARVNFSHGTYEEHLKRINMVKELREELGLPIRCCWIPRGRRFGPAISRMEGLSWSAARNSR